MANSKYSGVPVKAVSAGIDNKEIKKDKDIYSNEKNYVEFSNEEIRRVIDDFGRATELSLKAGYDGI